jgi:hypothetical protein
MANGRTSAQSWAARENGTSMTEALHMETDETPETLETRATPPACAHCGREFKPKRSDARFCSPACRLKAHRGVKPPPKPRPKRGGHKPDGKARYAEMKRQAEEADRIWNEEQAKKPRKPPVPYSDAIAEVILERLKKGESLNSICSGDDMPTESTVREWADDFSRPFAASYTRARERGWLVLADQLEDFASGESLGERRFEPGVVQRHRLQVDTRKWLLSKALPKVFGDKIDLTTGGEKLASVSDLELARRALHWQRLQALKAEEVVEAEVVAIEDERDEAEGPSAKSERFAEISTENQSSPNSLPIPEGQNEPKLE